MQNILMNLAFYLLVVAAGASFSLQQAANNHLRAELLSPWWAGFISYVGGSLAMLVMALVCRGPSLSWDMLSRTSPFSWTGGILGAIYIATAIFMIPKLGATTVLALMVVGQMLLSLMLDHYGLLGIPDYPVTGIRLLGVVLLVLGVVLIRWQA
ncbi:DMT family transporter [Escherichia coli]|uniref:DMT family transporter n=1 Tax=Escherichia coli TaxID=562 RepID=UPI00200FBDB8|nr:DMT family transporter [Escherichia coli]